MVCADRKAIVSTSRIVNLYYTPVYYRSARRRYRERQSRPATNTLEQWSERVASAVLGRRADRGPGVIWLMSSKSLSDEFARHGVKLVFLTGVALYSGPAIGAVVSR